MRRLAAGALSAILFVAALQVAFVAYLFFWGFPHLLSGHGYAMDWVMAGVAALFAIGLGALAVNLLRQALR